MSELTISSERLTAFAAHLRAEERSPGTIENYLRHIRAFAVWLDGSPVTKETAAAWKEHLLTQDYAPATVNAMLAALNGLFHFLGWDGCRVKFLRVQRRLFRDAGRELTRPEYERLMETARSRGQAGAAYGDDLRYRHPCLRSAVYHHGGSKTGPDGYLFKRENPNHPPAGKTLPEAAEIRAKTQNRFW